MFLLVEKKIESTPSIPLQGTASFPRVKELIGSATLLDEKVIRSPAILLDFGDFASIGSFSRGDSS